MVQGAVDYGMREGTNKLHGDGFLIDRNSALTRMVFSPAYNAPGKPIPPARYRIRLGRPPSAVPWFCPSSTTATTGASSSSASTFTVGIRAQTATARFQRRPRSRRRLHQLCQFQWRADSDLRSANGQQFMGCGGNQPNVICPNRIDPLSEDASAIYSRSKRDGNQLRPAEQRGPAIKSVRTRTGPGVSR